MGIKVIVLKWAMKGDWGEVALILGTRKEMKKEWEEKTSIFLQEIYRCQWKGIKCDLVDDVKVLVIKR
jgi:hypothetical protein